jgi:hypothetical protein
MEENKMATFNTVEEQEAFNSGVDYTKGYIAFCLRNYVDNLLDSTITGTCRFQNELCAFIQGKPYISNKANVSFKEFCENYEKYRLQL